MTQADPMAADDASNTISKAVRDFLAEAEEIVEQLGSELADLADMLDAGRAEPELLNSIFRGAHSLKGLAGMFGFEDISRLSHNMENLLDWLRLGRLKLDRQVVSILFESHEVLISLIRALAENSGDEPGERVNACIARISACLKLPRPDARPDLPLERLGLPREMLSSLTEYEEHRLLENLSSGRNIYRVHISLDLMTFDQELAQITERIKGCGEVVSTLPGIGGSGSMETCIDFDILAGSGLAPEAFAAQVNHERAVVTPVTVASQGEAHESDMPIAAAPSPSSQPAVGTGAPAAAEEPPVSSAATGGDTAFRSAKSMSRTVRVDIAKLDELMNIVGELVLAHSSIASLAGRLRTGRFSQMAVELGKAAKGLERKLTELQKGVMEIRMIPVGQLYDKMARIVRKISREQGKKVELSFFGADTELDKLIVEDISDPMMHIIRNAIDHGIEDPETRRQAGKNEKGLIRIASYQKGNHVVIEIEDDGSGIDIDRVRETARRKGLITDPGAFSDKDALDLIFLPGLSTTEQVSEVSGRGVGMDVVRNNIAAVSGMVDVETVYGKGTRFTITLPITLAIIKSLIISCAGRTYAMPVTSVLESLLLTRTDIRTVERKEVTQLRDMTLPLLRLEEFFRFAPRRSGPEEFYVVVVGIAEKRLGIVVDELQGQQDIVMKPLGEGFRRFPGIAGATDLGDQRTILVLDVAGIINDTMRSEG